MQLSLFGWPALASHLAALLFGLALGNLTGNRQSPAPQLPSNTILISFAGTLLKTHRLPSRGSSVILVRDGQDSGLSIEHGPAHPCRLTDDSATLLEPWPKPVLGLSFKSAAAVATILAAAKGNNLAIIAAESAPAYPKCFGRPQVSYGASD